MHKTKKLMFGFGVKQNIDAVLFLLLLTDIGLNLNLKKCLNKSVNNENLDLSRFFKNWEN